MLKSDFSKAWQKVETKLRSTAAKKRLQSADIDDVLQDTARKAYKNILQFDGRSSFYTWAFRIMVNRIAEIKRKKSVVTFRDLEEGMLPLSSSEPLPEECAMCHEEEKLFDTATSKLTGGEELRMRASGYSYEEIAGALDINVGTVRSRLSRARDAIYPLFHP